MSKKYNALVAVKVSANNENWTTIRTDTDLDAIINSWNELYPAIEPHVTARFVAVHAGGYRGVFAKRLSDLYSLVYVFEPDPLNFHCLVNNNQTDNVIKLQAAIANDHALVNVVNPNVTVGDVTYIANGDYPSLRIDDLNLQAANVLIFDIGGYEHRGILGSTQTIRKYQPVVVVKDSTDDINGLLTSQYGYTVVSTVSGFTIYKV
jgi:FkbM family methyltransferase